MVAAYFAMNKQSRDELHKQEQPTALLTSVLANVNRDPKQRKKPFEPGDFYVFQPAEAQDRPNGRYGAAYMEMIENRVLPPWALFCFSALSAEALGHEAPTPCFLQADGAILLGPTWTEEGIKGMFIATEGPRRAVEMLDPEGERHMVVIPEVKTKVIAEEEMTLKILR